MPATQTETAEDAVGSERKAEIEQLCTRVFGRAPDRVAFPGGKHRATFIADVAGDYFALARRPDEQAAAIEGIVMKCLSPTGLVPRLVTVKGPWVVQECMPGIRVPIAIDELEDMPDREALLDHCIAALASLQAHAHEERLQHRVAKLGAKEDWTFGHTDRPERISKVLGIQPPVVDLKPLAKRFRNDHRDFIKGDARPGNALVNDNRLVWIDWDGCGTRNALDDLAFILADEWTAIDPRTETRLLQKHLPSFARNRSDSEAYDYLMAYGVFHMCARIRRAIRYRQRDGKWWNRETCLLGDKIGVTKSEVGRMCARSMRWADEVAELRPMVPWFQQVMDRLRIEPAEDFAPAAEYAIAAAG
jgi:hypothetical protein